MVTFVDASRTAYDQGRRAYEDGKYHRAMDLGAAAEAWARVSNDLRRAEATTQPGAAPPPQTAPSQEKGRRKAPSGC